MGSELKAIIAEADLCGSGLFPLYPNEMIGRKKVSLGRISAVIQTERLVPRRAVCV